MYINRFYLFKTLTKCLFILSAIALTASCGDGNDNSRSDNEISNDNNSGSVSTKWWSTQSPDFSDNPDRPVISITGNSNLTLMVGDNYEDQGATATDLQDGDLTPEIVIENPVDTSEPGDYLVRYKVADSDQLNAIESVRIVRVFDEEPTVQTMRPVGTTASHLGYMEHLPVDYTDDPEKKFPLFIFNHGNAVNADFVGGTPESALAALASIAGAGPPLLIQAGKWDEQSPLIVLSPQMAEVGTKDPVERLNAFIDYAMSVYNIDPSRIYITGWSQGGFLSFLYAAEYPEKVAAIVPVSGGLLVTEELPENFCDIESVPIWAFHGDEDEVVSVANSIDSIEALNTNCTPAFSPKLTIFQGQQHSIHHGTFNLTLMENGSLGTTADPQYDMYDQSIFDWLLSHSLETTSAE